MFRDLASKLRPYLPHGVLILLVLLIYARVAGFGFVDYDDDVYVFNNPVVLGGLDLISFKWAFSTFYGANWHPLTWLSLLLDVRLFGVNPGAMHATNALLHLLNTLLAFSLFKRLTGKAGMSFMVAALFAVHPAHVESVAWIAERKDVLSTLFWLLCTYSYVLYAEPSDSPGAVAEGRREYFFAGALVLFLLGLMSKPMLVTLPFTLLLLDYWKLGRLNDLRDLKGVLFEKAPFFLMTAGSAYLTIIAQRAGGAVVALEQTSLTDRLQNTFVSYAGYIGMLFYPADLAVLYPYRSSLPAWEVAASVTILGLVTGFVLWQRRKRYLVFGWFWFLGTMVPVIGIVQVGSQALADRYTYVPYFGLFVMVVWSASDLARWMKLPAAALPVASAAAIALLTVTSVSQVSLWKDSETLLKHSIEVSPRDHILSQNLCLVLLEQDRLDEAETYCRRSLSVKPNYVKSLNSMGSISLKRGKFGVAADHFRNALKITPRDSYIKLNLVLALTLDKKPAEAEQLLDEVVADPKGEKRTERLLKYYLDIAQAYVAEGMEEKVPGVFSKVLKLSPNNPELKAGYARSLFETGRRDEAVRVADELLKESPDNVQALLVKGLSKKAAGEKAEAIAILKEVMSADPSNRDAAAALADLEGR